MSDTAADAQATAGPPEVKVLYRTEATAVGGRRGSASTSDGRLSVTFSSPAELGGDAGPGTNPEQLFAVGFAACWQNAMLGIARRRGLTADDSTVTAKLGFGLIASGRMGFELELLVHLPSITDREQAEQLIAEADQRCPFSNAVRGNVRVTITLV